jgi:hypothetical protein
MKRLTGRSATTAAPTGLASYPVSDWQDLIDRVRWLIRSALANRVSPGRLDEYTQEATQCGATWVLEYVTNPGGLSVTDLARRAARQGARMMFRQLVDYQRDRDLTPAADSPAGLPEPEPLPEATRLAELQAVRWAARQHRQHWETLTAAWASAARPVRRRRIERGQIGWRSDHNRRPVDQTWIVTNDSRTVFAQVCIGGDRSSINSDQTVTAGERHYENAGPTIDRGHIITGTGSGVAARPIANCLPESPPAVSYRYLPGVEVFPVTLFAPADREERSRYVDWLRCFAR